MERTIEPHLPLARASCLHRPARFRREHPEIEGRALADGRGAQIDDADADARQQAAERLTIGDFECLPHIIFGKTLPRRDGKGCRDRMRLPQIMHVEFEADFHAFDGQSRAFHHATRCFRLTGHAGRKGRAIQPLEGEVQRLHLIVADIRDHASQSRGHARKARHERGFEAHFLQQRTRMQGPAPAKRHERETPGIMPALDGNQPDRPGHARIRDA